MKGPPPPGYGGQSMCIPVLSTTMEVIRQREEDGLMTAQNVQALTGRI